MAAFARVVGKLECGGVMRPGAFFVSFGGFASGFRARVSCTRALSRLNTLLPLRIELRVRGNRHQRDCFSVPS